MSDERAEMLKILFAIPQSRIDRDIAVGERNFQRLVEDIRATTSRQHDNTSPRIIAQYHHQQMVQAKVARSLETVPEDYRFFLVVMAAEAIVEEAVCNAHDKGRLGELGRQMDEIRKREGFHQDHHWVSGGPADYHQAHQESEQLFDKVHETVFTTLLRRYRLDEMAALYEQDRGEYDDRREKGRKAFFEDGARK